MVLSDRDIREQLRLGRVVIDPLDWRCIQPASVDVRLSNVFQVFRNTFRPYVDVKQDNSDLSELVKVDGDGPLMLHPGEFILGLTVEKIALPDDIVGRLEGKSSLGRLGLLVHATAGYVDPGWSGRLTMEMSNVSNLPITLYPGMKIAQLSLLRLSSPAENLYGSPSLGSKYQGDEGPASSRVHLDFVEGKL